MGSLDRARAVELHDVPHYTYRVTHETQWRIRSAVKAFRLVRGFYNSAAANPTEFMDRPLLSLSVLVE